MFWWKDKTFFSWRTQKKSLLLYEKESNGLDFFLHVRECLIIHIIVVVDGIYLPTSSDFSHSFNIEI